jgi:receptor protein-tyrosine kinase
VSTIEKALAKQIKAKQIKAEQNKKNTQTIVEKSELSSLKSTQKPLKINSENQSQKDELNVESNPDDIFLDGEKLTERGFIYGADSTHHIQEEFRHIKRKLINNAFGAASKTLHHSNLVMVSSSNPNEGKTFISINLALSIALEQDKTVLLVDADVLRPSLHRELEFEHKKGLLEYLLSETHSLSEVIYNTNIPNLKIIPAGKPHHLTNELLASTKMEHLAKELADRYPDRIVIFDCPPILGVTETPVVSSLVGQAVVVVEESKTKIDDVKTAVSQLDENMAIGFVMNKTIRSKKDVYGYYGYGYGKKHQ